MRQATLAGARVEAELVGDGGDLEQGELLGCRVDGRGDLGGGGTACHTVSMKQGCDRVAACWEPRWRRLRWGSSSCSSRCRRRSAPWCSREQRFRRSRVDILCPYAGCS